MIRLDEIEVSRDDVQRMDALLSAMGQRLDANETMLFARQLEFIKARTYDVKYPEFRARDFIPAPAETANNAVDTITYRSWDSFGMAAVIDDYAKDLPRVGAKAKEVSAKVKSIGNSYGYSIQDIRAAAHAGVPLDATLASAARRYVEASFDEVAAKGLPSAEIPGFINNPNVSVATPTHGTWSNNTAEEILKDLRVFVKGMVVDSKGVHKPDTLLLPIDLFELIAAMPAGANLTDTVLSLFLRTNPHIRNVDSWYLLDDAAADGTGRIVAYQRSNEVLDLQIPQPFEQFPAQARALAFEIPCHGRISGTEIRYPLGVRYMDGCSG